MIIDTTQSKIESKLNKRLLLLSRAHHYRFMKVMAEIVRLAAEESDEE